jgi:phage baseplate assembly protein W
MDERKDFLGRGWAMPVDLDPRTGLVATSEYEDNIRQSILIVLETAPNERVMRPIGCGIHDLVFTAVDTTTIQRIRSVIEERCVATKRASGVLGVTVDEDATSSKLLIELEYRIPGRQIGNLVLPFYFREEAAVKPPGLEPRRFSDFERERGPRPCRIPSWDLADGERDFGRAARSRGSIPGAEQLIQVGVVRRRFRLARGWWQAAGARMPVAFQRRHGARVVDHATSGADAVVPRHECFVRPKPTLYVPGGFSSSREWIRQG